MTFINGKTNMVRDIVLSQIADVIYKILSSLFAVDQHQIISNLDFRTIQYIY